MQSDKLVQLIRAAIATIAVLASAQRLQAQVTLTAPPSATAMVRGVVFDSLSMSPAVNATVWLPGGTQTTKTDDKGRFELDDVPKGVQFLAFSNAALDSLGLGTLGTRVDVNASGLPVQLSTPSFATVWRTLCAGADVASRTDSGIVWGTVRDAASDTRLSGALAGFSWYDLKLMPDKKYAFSEITHQTSTDSTGNYYACGLPSDIKITSEATGTKSASGAVEYVIGARRLFRVDMLVSVDMVQPGTPATNSELLSTMRARGTATLRGVLRDHKQKPVPNAIVTLASVDTAVRANDQGEFVMTGMPSGSHVLQARVIGFGPASMLVELRPEQTTTVTLDLPAAQALATVNVRAERAAGKDKLAFDDRRRTGWGYALTEKEIAGRFDILSMMLGLPRMQIVRGRGPPTIAINSRRGGLCVPRIYLDGLPAATDEITMYEPKDMRAVEVYNSEFNVPMGYNSGGCGVVLFWSKRNPRW